MSSIDILLRVSKAKAAEIKIVQASFQGSFKVAELLLEEGVRKDSLSRWNISPFEEAVNNRSYVGPDNKIKMCFFYNLEPIISI